MVLIHGEDDCKLETTRAAYLSAATTLISDWRGDRADGLTDVIPIFISQCAPNNQYIQVPNSYYSGNYQTILAQLDLAETVAGCYLIAPGYSHDFREDGLHQTNHDARWLGCKFAEAAYLYHVLGRKPGTVRPLSISWIDAYTVDVSLYVPVPPLVFDTDAVLPADEALGFVAYAAGGDTEIAIERVRIISNYIVRINTSAPISIGDDIGYAIKNYVNNEKGGVGGGRRCGPRGNLRDSNIGFALYNDLDGYPYSLWNWCASFRKAVTS